MAACRGALNDSYKTDICLMHTPQTIALACILVVNYPIFMPVLNLAT